VQVAHGKLSHLDTSLSFAERTKIWLASHIGRKSGPDESPGAGRARLNIPAYTIGARRFTRCPQWTCHCVSAGDWHGGDMGQELIFKVATAISDEDEPSIMPHCVAMDTPLNTKG